LFPQTKTTPYSVQSPTYPRPQPTCTASRSASPPPSICAATRRPARRCSAT
jgi:hypothetical protein